MSDRTTIIHISDIHFGPNLIPIGNVNEHGLPHTEEIIPTGDILFINWLDRTIPLEDRSNCFLVVTGDVSSAGRSEEFEKFFEFLEKTKIPQEQIIVTVGNHDANWSVEFDERFDNFNEYARKTGILTPFSDDNAHGLTCKYFPEQNILFYCLNSAYLLSGVKDRSITKLKDFINKFGIIARFSSDYKEILDNLDKMELVDAPVIGNKVQDIQNNVMEELSKYEVDESKILKVAAVHHHINPTPQTEVRAYDVIMDSGILKNVLRNSDFDFVLHGHKHSSFLSKEFVYNDNIKKPDLHILGAGTLGATDSGNSFNLMEITSSGGEPNNISLDRYELDQAHSFSSQEHHQIDLDKLNYCPGYLFDENVKSRFRLEMISEDRTMKAEYDQYMNAANREIIVLSSSSMNGFQQDYTDTLLQKAKDGVRIRLMVPDPDLEWMYDGKNKKLLAIRDIEERNTEGANDMQVKKLIDNVTSFNKALKTENSDNLIQLKGYRSLPHTMIFIIDDILYFGPYLHRTNSIKCLTFKARAPGTLYKIYKKHFDDIWNDSQFTRSLV